MTQRLPATMIIQPAFRKLPVLSPACYVFSGLVVMTLTPHSAHS